jgi:hypothetical protein
MEFKAMDWVSQSVTNYSRDISVSSSGVIRLGWWARIMLDNSGSGAGEAAALQPIKVSPSPLPFYLPYPTHPTRPTSTPPEARFSNNCTTLLHSCELNTFELFFDRERLPQPLASYLLLSFLPPSIPPLLMSLSPTSSPSSLLPHPLRKLSPSPQPLPLPSLFHRNSPCYRSCRPKCGGLGMA